MRISIRIAVGLLLLSAAVASAETERGKINGNRDLVFSWIADTDQSSRVTVMWDKSAADIDTAAFILSGGNAVTVGAGLSATDGLEVIEIGVIPGSVYVVNLSLFTGPQTKYNLNISTMDSEIVTRQAPSPAGDNGQLRYVGELQTLAQEDPAFADMLRVVEDLRAQKEAAGGR